MAKSKAEPLELQLVRLAAVRKEPLSETTTATLRSALSGRQNLLAAKAADLAGELGRGDLVPDLAAVFDRFLAGGADKGCAATTAIAKALDLLACGDPDPFRRGVRHVQMEAGWPRASDAAAELRGVCGLALARLNPRDVLTVLADLLADPEPTTRLNAARAVAHTGREEGAPLLRLKVHLGDPEAAVLAECLAGILRLTPTPGVEFASRLADTAGYAMRELALSALGESRLSEAFESLKARWHGNLSPSPRQGVLPAIAMIRSEAAINFLLDLIGSGGSTARQAVQALSVYRTDPHLRARVEAAVRGQGDDDLTSTFDAQFSSRNRA